ncbi:MAG TPA: sigma-70 family RNA polymerase sigma factor [Candidatus Acidoferrales bacterium]|nr:sigma-70 family RNA polymerase sigma factor [Candidatus Acidoferrales bacterium]
MRVSGTLGFAAARCVPPARDWTADAAGAAAMRPSERPMDAAQFQGFYAGAAPGLRGYIRRACGNDALADDILQESFLRFLRAELRVNEAAPLKAYLYKIAASLIVDHWRRVQRERRWSLRSFLGREPATEPTGENETIRFFRRLKPQEQLLLWLAYVEGFEHAEIAAALGVKEKSVRVLLFRARNKLARTLETSGLAPNAGGRKKR